MPKKRILHLLLLGTPVQMRALAAPPQTLPQGNHRDWFQAEPSNKLSRHFHPAQPSNTSQPPPPFALSEPQLPGDRRSRGLRSLLRPKGVPRWPHGPDRQFCRR